MIFKNGMQLKALIKNKSKELNVAPQLVLQNYMLERLIDRISRSEYSNQFIIKGGFLLSSIVGLSTRATMDLDTTIKGFTLTKENLENIINDVCKIDIDDGIEFKINRIEDIRETDDYPGLRVLIGAKYEMVLVPLSIDVTTGDMIIPKEIQYSFSTMFDDYQIQMFTYTLETVLAEKIETILTRGIANTRPRDFYDVYILYKFKGELIDYTILKDALNATTIKRGSEYILVNQGSILETIRKSEELQGFWNRYQKRYKYAEGIQYEDTCKAVESILDRLGKQKNQV